MTPQERSALAAEYVLGLLEGADLEHARHLARDDPQFAAEIAQWAGDLAPLLDEIEPVAPPRGLLAAIEHRLGRPAPDRDNVHQLRRRLRVWRGFAAGASALAASLALVLVTRPEAVEQVPVARAPAEPMVASMAADDSDARLVATWDPGDRSLVLTAVDGLEPIPDRAHELWVIPADGRPRSMGVLPGAASTHLRVGADLASQLAEGATLAVSVEPAGGSPTGQPTGAVVAAGPLQRT